MIIIQPHTCVVFLFLNSSKAYLKYRRLQRLQFSPNISLDCAPIRSYDAMPRVYFIFRKFAAPYSVSFATSRELGLPALYVSPCRKLHRTREGSTLPRG